MDTNTGSMDAIYTDSEAPPAGEDSALAALDREEAALRALLQQHDVAGRREQYLEREQARHDAESAAREVMTLRQQLSGVPSREVLEANRSRLRSAEALGRRHMATEASRRAAETELRRFLDNPTPNRTPLIILLFAAGEIALYFLRGSVFHGNNALYAAAAGALLICFLIAMLRQRKLLRDAKKKREELELALQSAEESVEKLKDTAREMLRQLYADIPAKDAGDADRYVRENLDRYDRLAQAEALALEKTAHFSAIPKPDLKGVPAFAVDRPEQSEEDIRKALEQIAQRRAELKKAAAE